MGCESVLGLGFVPRVCLLFVGPPARPLGGWCVGGYSCAVRVRRVAGGARLLVPDSV